MDAHKDPSSSRLTRKSGSRQPAAPASPAGHVILFWALTTIAALLFTPCILLPVWNETEALKQQERELNRQLAELEARIDRQRRVIDALLDDQLVNERLARRELNYSHPDERVVPVPTVRVPPAAHASASATGDVDAASDSDGARPKWAVALARWLPDWPWTELFAREPRRTIMIAMAGGIFATALLLYGPPSSSRRAKRATRGLLDGY